MATRQPKLDERTRQERLRESKRKHEERKRRAAGIPPIGSLMQCERCPAQVPRTSGSQRYCPECKKLAKAEWRRIANDKYNQTHGRFKEAPEKLRDRNRQYVARHPERCRQAQARYREANREKINAYSRARSQVEERREWLRKWMREKRRTDPMFAVNSRMSRAIWNSLKGKKAGRSWESLVGYTVDDLMRHLERQFCKGMSWANRHLWHIDHRVPLSSFSFVSSDDPEFRAAWALSNLSPLWRGENLSKSDKRLFLV